MATKLNPGPVDCYAKLEPDEPFYLLMARSRLAPLHARMELLNRQWEIRLGLRPDTLEERVQIAEGFACVTEMEIWYRQWETRRKVEALKFDDKGRPTTGPHAYVEHATTSGANES